MVVFQPSIFRGELAVSFRECTLQISHERSTKIEINVLVDPSHLWIDGAQHRSERWDAAAPVIPGHLNML